MPTCERVKGYQKPWHRKNWRFWVFFCQIEHNKAIYRYFFGPVVTLHFSRLVIIHSAIFQRCRSFPAQRSPLPTSLMNWSLCSFTSLSLIKRSIRTSREQGHLLTPTAEAKQNICTLDQIAQPDTASLPVSGGSLLHGCSTELLTGTASYLQSCLRFLRMKIIHIIKTLWMNDNAATLKNIFSLYLNADRKQRTVKGVTVLSIPRSRKPTK